MRQLNCHKTWHQTKSTPINYTNWNVQCTTCLANVPSKLPKLIMVPPRNSFTVVKYYYINHASILSLHGSKAPITPRLRHWPGSWSHSVGLLRASDQPVGETSTWKHTTLARDRHTFCPTGFERAIPADSRLRPRGHQDRVTQVTEYDTAV